MTDIAKKGDWVRVHNTVLTLGERAPQVPDETKAVPLEMWVNGFLLEDEARIGQQATVQTLAGREIKGELTAIRPVYQVDYGEPQAELLRIGQELRALLREVNHA